MCGRYLILTEEENIETLRIIAEINKKYLSFQPGEVFPGSLIPVLTNNTDSQNAQLMFWGFPFFGSSTIKTIINARAETIREKPMFSQLCAAKRCIVPANGFFEWSAAAAKSKRKTKYAIRPQFNQNDSDIKDSSFFYMAGLYNSYSVKSLSKISGIDRMISLLSTAVQLPQITRINCAVIITTSASNQMKQIHDRMPILLSQKSANYWLSDTPINTIFQTGILSPCTENLLIQEASS